MINGARFYTELFGCVLVPPERHYTGWTLEQGTGVSAQNVLGFRHIALTTSAGTQVTWCYVTDPEGNIIELQSWDPSAGIG